MTRAFRLKSVLVIFVVMNASTTRAYDDTTFESDVTGAYTSFHVATSYLRTDNASIGGLELAEAVTKWRAITQKVKASPPPSYAADTALNGAFARINEILSKSLDLTDAGETRKAYENLLGVRDILYNLRQRNGKRVYADCVTELNRVMTDIIPMRRKAPNLSYSLAKAKAGQLFKDYRAKLGECHGMAPTIHLQNEEFQRIFRQTSVSAEESLAAVERENEGELFRMLGEIISFDRIIFFRFGG